MVAWLKRLVFGDGNVLRERAYTNWNTLDVEAIIAEKERETRGQAGSVSAADGATFSADTGVRHDKGKGRA